ncbi:MAG TPA: NACHT domain-containing protein, partial [Roseiflexaceae bacterium]
MSESQNEREREVAELEAALRMPLPDAARRQIELTLENLRGEGANLAVANTIAHDLNQGAVNLSDDARIDGVAVGVNLGRIIYGRDPQEDERRRLVWYLDALANQLYRLPLRGLEERLAQGDGVALPRVYVTLASESFVEVARGQTRELWRYFQDGKLDQPLTSEYDPDYALPDQAIVRVESLNLPRRDERILPLALSRSKLATESVQQRQHLVLLGDPGGGKSTFLRHLAWALAMRGLDQHDEATTLIGWSDDRQLLPILLPLRSLAGRLARDGAHAMTVYAALRDELLSCNLTQVDDLLRESLHRGAALLLLDGLDEVPPEAADDVANRLTTLQAICSFAQLHPQARVVMTCRVRAFADDLRSLLGWDVETLAPFTLGQIRHFVPTWYAELVAKGQITGEQAGQLEHALIATIVASPKLRAMAGTPLLLTMMALVLYNKGELPRDRPQLYERILELLLGQWDKVRDGQSLAEAIGLPDWGSERIRPLLDRLSYDAHAGAVSEDGRGRLTRGDVRDALIAFFEAARLPDPWGVARRCLDYFEQRSGLLVPDESASYVFAHLTLQEHCAGRHIALGSDDPVALVMRHRADDRWREPIFLGAGLLRPAELNALLSDLIGREEDEQLKPIDRWYRDLILAAEIGADRDWDYLRTRPMVKVDRIQGDLRRGLVELLR